MGHDVFISHSSKDKAVADAVCAALESHAIRCWIAPRDIVPGMDWSEAIVRGIAECPVLALVFSQNANDSIQVRREVQRACERGRTVIALRIDAVMPNEALEYYLSSLHWINASSPPAPEHLDLLVQTVQRVLAPPDAQEGPRVSSPPAAAPDPSVLSPATSAISPPAVGNLPVATTPFIGRETELTAWQALLLSPTTRVLTLAGFGGMGKTRSALELATQCAACFSHGAFWIELEEAHTAEDMQQRIAHGLGLILKPDSSVQEALTAFLHDRQVLMTLDNTEQIPDAGKVVHALAQNAPRVKWLVASRHPLEIAEEQVVEVPPLTQEAAEDLFLQRAQARQAEFQRTEENAEDIAELCRRLEGMPLAIELAASRIVGMTPRDILNRLSEWFRLLQTRAPHLPPRQRAMNGAIEWSHELLGDEDKALFAQLAVFSHGFTLDAAEAVCDVFDVFEGVQELRRHSFLRTETQATTQRMRFLMLELVRDYAEQKLSGVEARRRHADFFLEFAEKQVTKLRTQDETRALDELSVEFDNLKSALFWAKQAGEQALCARLALALAPALYSRGLWTDALRCLQAGYEAAGALTGEERRLPMALGIRLAGLALDRGESDIAQSKAEEALTLAEALNDPAGKADAINLLGLLAREAGENDRARELFEKTLTLRTETDHNGRAISLHNLARLATTRKEFEEAKRLYQESLTHRRAAGDLRGEAEILGNLGALAYRADNREEAQRLYRESLKLRRDLKDRHGIALMLYNLGEVAEAENEGAVALALYVHAERMLHEQHSALANVASETLARLATAQGETEFTAARQASLNAGWETLV